MAMGDVQSNTVNPTEWTDVVKKGKKKKRTAKEEAPKLSRATRSNTNETTANILRNRVSKSAAAMINQPEGDGVTLTSIMRKVASHMDLKSLEIMVKNTRRTKARGILLEIYIEKDADRLDDRIRGHFRPRGWTKSYYSHPPTQHSVMD